MLIPNPDASVSFENPSKGTAWSHSMSALAFFTMYKAVFLARSATMRAFNSAAARIASSLPAISIDMESAERKT
jgi:hypothetical protein